jgi:phosphonopyruvate decarboxylase
MGMLSLDAADVIARNRGEAIVVCTMTTIMTFAQRHPHPLNMRVAPLMGGASSIGLGLALALPGKRVLVLDGDGSLAMQLGTVLTISEAAPENLYHFVFHNGVLYEGGGRLPIAGSGMADLAGIARSAGYSAVRCYSRLQELEQDMESLLALRGPVFILLEIDIPPTPRWSEDNTQAELPDWWFTQMYEDARRIKKELLKAPANRNSQNADQR